MAENLTRPNPDELLARVKAEEAQEKRGKLKIFLGYAPGVGKTYHMLEDARLKVRDTDVVAAVVESHGRADTEALLTGFEVMPRKEEDYRGIKLAEMDLDAILKRRPQLALVDELAHTNAPGLRHEKRYQDVEELLEAGIDVYSTLNIQHVESVRDVVAQITGVWVRETIPDSIIDKASEIELIDLPPDELLARLKEGKVYIPQQIQNAIERFFQRGNLLALRELTMRTAAKHLDEQTLAYMRAHSIQGPWSSSERLLLFIGPDSSGSRLVRSARRLAYELGAEWTAMYVETPDSDRFSPDQQEQIMDSLRLAQRLGAKTITVQGASVAPMVMEYAENNRITKIVMAKPPGRRLGRLRGESIASQIVRLSEHIDVHMVSAGGEAGKRVKRPGVGVVGNWRGYLYGLGLVVVATFLGQLIHQLFSPATTVMMYLLAVVVTAYLWGLGPSIVVSLVGVLAFDFFHVPPYWTFRLADTQYVFTFLSLILVGFVISYLTSRVRRQTEAAIHRERETASLYALGRDLAVTNDMKSYVQAIIKRSKETFGHDTIIFLPDPPNSAILKLYLSEPKIAVDENELAAAIWAFQHQRIVGHGTDTLPNAKSRYLPLVTPRGIVGVLALSAADGGEELTVEQEQLLEAYADLAAIAIESINLNEQAHTKNTSTAREKPPVQ